MSFISMFCKFNKVALTAFMLCIAVSCYANKQSVGTTNFIEGSNQNNNVVQSTPNSFVELDFSTTIGESWDAKDQPNNVVANCFNGKTITGFETSNITIETIGSSYFSEAIVYFSDSSQGDDNAIKLRVGAGNHASGTEVFSTASLLDITDSGNVDVVSLSDEKFYIQLYEETDDNPNGIDARYTTGKLKVWGIDLVANSSSCPFISGNSPADADLSVEQTINQLGDNTIGDSLEFSITVLNNSTVDSALNVILANTLSTNLQMTNTTCDDGSNTVNASDILMLGVSDIPANDSLQCTITADIIGHGELSNHLVVFSDNDVDTSNNSVVAAIRGPAIVVPVNNLLSLFVLMFIMFFLAGRYIKTL